MYEYAHRYDEHVFFSLGTFFSFKKRKYQSTTLTTSRDDRPDEPDDTAPNRRPARRCQKKASLRAPDELGPGTRAERPADGRKQHTWSSSRTMGSKNVNTGTGSHEQGRPAGQQERLKKAPARSSSPSQTMVKKKAEPLGESRRSSRNREH